ncbi:MAG: competence protein ComEA [Campylobacterota bacterium]|nr:competence protein ComEA [Campylobacterota bacterium]
MKLLVLLFFSVAMLFSSIDINKASKEELMGLSGIGEKRAAAILEYRKQKCFKNVNELTRVKGIGDKFMQENRKNLTASKCL